MILLIGVAALDQRQEDLVQRGGQRVQRLRGDLAEEQLLQKGKRRLILILILNSIRESQSRDTGKEYIHRR